MIDLFRPYLPHGTVEAVGEVLGSRFIGQGPRVDEFEKEYEKLFNVKYAVTLNSGTSALETAYDLIGLKEGDEVITTPLTCTATNLPLLDRGCKLIWADIREDNLCLDRKSVLEKITHKTKTIVNVHLGGIENDLGEVPVPTVADACQALGVFNGDYTCCSFQAIKHISTGDGGMLTCPTPEQYRQAKLIRWFGIDRERKLKNNWQAYTERQMTFDIEMIGYKRQMTDIAAVMGLCGLKAYHNILEHRTNNYLKYVEGLAGVDGIKIVGLGQNSVHWLMTVLIEKRRDDFAKAMFEAGIDTNLVQIRNDVFKIFGGKRQELPVMNKVEGQYISLPIGMNASIDDVAYITDTIRRGW